jgi:hypothetical protein
MVDVCVFDVGVGPCAYPRGDHRGIAPTSQTAELGRLDSDA